MSFAKVLFPDSLEYLVLGHYCFNSLGSGLILFSDCFFELGLELCSSFRRPYTVAIFQGVQRVLQLLLQILLHFQESTNIAGLVLLLQLESQGLVFLRLLKLASQLSVFLLQNKSISRCHCCCCYCCSRGF